MSNSLNHGFDFSAFYEKYSTHLPNNKIPSDKFLTWLIGFTDGEGCFTCSIGETKGFTFNFNISQKWEINLKVLEHFSELFRNGIVSRHSVENVYEFRVGGVNNCKILFPYFDNYPLYTKKSLSYKLWKDIHKSLVNKDHLNESKRREMIEKAKMINKSKNL